MIICLCHDVSDTEINQAIDDGLNSFAQVQNALKVGTRCGACACEAKAVVEQHLQAEKEQATLLQSSVSAEEVCHFQVSKT